MRKFHRKRGPRRAFLKGLAYNLIMREKMETTAARAKEIRPLVERLIAAVIRGKRMEDRGKKGGELAALRRLLSKLPKPAAMKLFHEIAPRYKDRQGGYLRIIKEVQTRKRDGAPLAVIEFVQ